MTDAEFLLRTEARLEAKLPGVQHLYFSKREIFQLHCLADQNWPRMVKGKKQRLTAFRVRQLLDKAQNIIAAQVAAKLTDDSPPLFKGTPTGRSSYPAPVPGFQSLRRRAGP